MNILAIGAHPDDVELGCFGTLMELKRRGHSVFAVALVSGAYGTHPWEAIEETWNAARAILQTGEGNADYVLGNFQNGRLQHDWSTVGFVDRLIKDHDIDTVVTHHYGEAHQDHIAAQKIAVSAARRQVERLWLWESSIYTHRNVHPFRPQLYVAISDDAFRRKMEALEIYLSAGLLEQQEVDAHRYLARYRGAETRREYAEAFEVVWNVYEQ